MQVPPSSASKPPAGAATRSGCSSNLEPGALPANLGRFGAALIPAFTLVLYARSFWGSPAFGELADQGFHLELGRAFALAWEAGEFPPRWSATANGGRGSPAFELYPPLFAFVTAAWVGALGADVEALRFAAFTAALFNLSAIYWAGRGRLSRERAAVAAGLALLLPGATFVGLGRGMFPNFLALGWAALAAGAAGRRSVPLLAAAGAGLILTHTPTAYIAAILAVALGWGAWRRLLLAGTLSVAGTAWFWLPMLDAARHAQTAYLTESHPYGDSLWFVTRQAETAFQGDWAFLNEAAMGIGLAQLALALVAWLAFPRKALAAAACLTVAASIPPTGEWLTLLPAYDKVQFCWRWQPVLGLAIAWALAATPGRKIAAPAVAAALVILLFLPLAAPSKKRPGEIPDLASNLIEMRPLGAPDEKYPPGTFGEVEVVQGDCAVSPLLVEPARRRYRVTAVTDCTLRLRTYHFPRWRAWLHGAPWPIEREQETQLQIVRTPAGEGILEVRYQALGRGAGALLLVFGGGEG